MSDKIDFTTKIDCLGSVDTADLLAMWFEKKRILHQMSTNHPTAIMVKEDLKDIDKEINRRIPKPSSDSDDRIFE